MDSISGSRKVVVYAEGKVFRVFEGADVEKLQNEAVVLKSELVAMGKKGVEIKTLQGISG